MESKCNNSSSSKNIFSKIHGFAITIHCNKFTIRCDCFKKPFPVMAVSYTKGEQMAKHININIDLNIKFPFTYILGYIDVTQCERSQR